MKCFQDLYNFNSVNNSSSILIKTRIFIVRSEFSFPLFHESKNSHANDVPAWYSDTEKNGIAKVIG